MTDSDLRALERRFRSSGSIQDEVAWLRGRLQAGEVALDGLRLAALLGHEGARGALGEAAPQPTLVFREWDQPVEFNPLFNMVRDCADCGSEALVRLTVALSRHLLPWFERARTSDSGPRVAIETSERWLVGPDKVSLTMLREAGWAAGASSDDVIFEDVMAHQVAELAQRTAEAAQNAHAGDHRRTLLSAEGAALEALRTRDPEDAVQLEAAVSSELVPWALGLSDPVAERARARTQGP